MMPSNRNAQDRRVRGRHSLGKGMVANKINYLDDILATVATAVADRSSGPSSENFHYVSDR
jgi:hypothetical protein